MNHVLATANTGEIGKGFGKNEGEWTGSVEISKEEIPGSKHSIMAIYWPTPGFKGRTFKLCSHQTLISASAAPHCGEPVQQTNEVAYRRRVPVATDRMVGLSLSQYKLYPYLTPFLFTITKTCKFNNILVYSYYALMRSFVYVTRPEVGSCGRRN